MTARYLINVDTQIRWYLALWKATRLPVEKLLTTVGPLEDINIMLDELDAGRAVRQIVLPTE